MEGRVVLQITSRLKSRNGRTRREWLDNEKLLLGLRMEGNLSVAQNETGATESVLKENSTCRSHVIFPQFPQVLALPTDLKVWEVWEEPRGVGIHLGTQNRKGI